MSETSNTGSVKPDSHLTLHYRVSLADDTEIISTFGHSPATLQMGGGQLADNLEKCLFGLNVGDRNVFLLEPDQAYGAHNPKLLERIARSALPQDAKLEVSSWMEFADTQGVRFTGLLRELADDYALFDFNHPLAGQSIKFEVEIIGVL